MEPSNSKKNNIKIESVKSKETNIVQGRVSDRITSWEFFKKADDLFTDYITKMVNIPSTFLTPAFVLPTKMGFLKMLEILAFLKITFQKIEQISAILDKNEKRSSERKKIAKLAIFNALNKFTSQTCGNAGVETPSPNLAERKNGKVKVNWGDK